MCFVSSGIGQYLPGVPLVTVKVSQNVESAALLAEALGNTILDQAAELEMVWTNPVTLIVLLGRAQVIIAAVNLLTKLSDQ